MPYIKDGPGQTVHVSFTAKEISGLDHKADALGLSRKAYVKRMALNGKVKGYNLKPIQDHSVALGEVAAAVRDMIAKPHPDRWAYEAWLAPMEDINRIRNYTFRDEDVHTKATVKGIIERVHGEGGTEYLRKLLQDITNGVKGTHGETAYMSGIVGNYKAASVGANLRVIVQQPTAILRAADMIDVKYLASGMKPAGGWKKAVKYAPIAQWKDWGYFDINTGRQMKDVLFDTDSTLDKVKNASMWGAGKMDSLSWGMLWNAVEAETRDTRKELQPGSEAYYAAVAARFTEIIDHTQVVDGILQRSQIMRSGDGLTKMATSFMGEPTKQYNMMMQAVYDARTATGDRKAEAKRRLARTVLTLAISGVVNAMAQSIMDAVRDDDKEKEYWEKWQAAFADNAAATFNPAAYVPYVKDVLSVFQGYDVSRMDMDTIADVYEAIRNMNKALNGEGKYTLASASANLFFTTAKLIGVPLANLKREIKSFAMLAAVELGDYKMQYDMEKISLRMNYSGNKSTFMDILYNAYVHAPEAYEIIYADLLKEDKLKTEDKTTAEVIASAMEDRMKKAQGTTKVSELEHRYLSPDQQKSYDRKMSSIQGSSIWRGATGEQRKATEDDLFELITGTMNDKKQEKIEGGLAYGLSDTDYILYELALSMVDEPNKNGKLGGNPTNAEIEAAIELLELGDDASSYLWEAAGKSAKNNPWK